MSGHTRPAAGDGRHHSAVTAIGGCLADMYDVYLHSPLPERLKLLLKRIDEADSGSRPDGVREPRAALRSAVT
jgi:hypothetical protein